MPTPLDLNELVAKIAAYYKKPGNECGGNLHIVLDDGNVGIDSVIFCVERCQELHDIDGIELCLMLGELTEDHREALYSYEWKNANAIADILADKQSAEDLVDKELEGDSND